MNTRKSFGKARHYLMILLILAMSVGSVPIQAQDDEGSFTEIFLPIVQRMGDDTNNQEGGEVSAAIVGGNVVQQQIPWMVALVHRNMNSVNGQFCGGTLIAPEWVLTAAHCVDDKSGSDIDVVIGRNDLTTQDGERIEVKSDGVELNSYDDGTKSNDIALLHLVQPSQAQTIPLNYDYLNVSIGMSGWVLGWGYVDTQQTHEPYLKEASIALVPAETCGDSNGVADNDICLGTLDGTSSTCNGDSGGPLLVLINNEWRQVGITSFRNGDCGTPGSYWYDERISKHESWILSTIAPVCTQSASAASISAASANDCVTPTNTPVPGSSPTATPPALTATPTPTPPVGGTVQPGQAQLYYQENFSGGIAWDGGTGFNNAPNANSKSLKMPPTWSAFVWASDNRSGDGSCFKGETANLGAWSNRIQSIEVYDYDICGGGNNPDAVLCTDTGSNPSQGCRGFSVGLHDLTTLGLNDIYRSIKSIGSGKSIMLFREGGYRGTAECYNGPRAQLPGMEYGSEAKWDLAAQVTTLQVFSSSDCPVSQLKSLVLYESDNNGGAAVGVGTMTGVFNLSEIPHAGSGWSYNDWGASVRIPTGMSIKAYIHNNRGGNDTGCKVGNVNLTGEFYRQVSSVWLFDTPNCTAVLPPSLPPSTGYTYNLNAGGGADVISLNPTGTQNAYTLVNSPQAYEYLAAHWTIGSTSLLLGDDFNGDGRDDMLAINPSGNRVLYVLPNTATNVFGSEYIAGSWGVYPGQLLVSGDFNKDGYADLGLHNPTGSRHVYILLNNKQGSFSSPDYKSTYWNILPGQLMIAGDFSGDGYADLASVNPSGTKNVYILRNSGNGHFVTTDYLAGNIAIDPGDKFLSGDFNSDGRDDILVHRTMSSKRFYLYTTNAAGNLNAAQDVGWVDVSSGQFMIAGEFAK